MSNTQHDADILDQFTRQAIPFAERHGADVELLQLLVEASEVSSRDRVLDIACGPGIVSCAYAEIAKHVTGLDMVPAMLECAKILQGKKGLSNLDWKQGSAMELPFSEGEFDQIVTRFSFHHYTEPKAAFSEMVRVCKPAGIVMVTDVTPSGPARAAYDEVEKLRDPSHTRALIEIEFKALGHDAGMKLVRKVSCRLESDLEGLLASSFPRPGDADKVRALFRKDIDAGMNRLGVQAHLREGNIYFYFPITAFVWKKP